MKTPYVSEFQPNQNVSATLLVILKDIRQKKTGDPYLSMVLGDRSGELDAKMWDNVEEVLDTFNRDDFVRVKGILQIHQSRPQLTIHKMARVLDSEVDLSDYLPASERNPDDMVAELRQIAARVSNPHLAGLLRAFLADERFMRAFRTAPAAKTVHHAFLGGLIEHVLSLCNLSLAMAAHYPYIDADLLLTGAILHDTGKVAELTYGRSFGYSAEGQLLGHIVIGLRMLGEKLALLPDFPPRLRTLVEHMIVSHHGELEYGSPKTPLFPEALLLHHLDNLDSKMECMRALVARNRHSEGNWTAYSPILERSVLKKASFLEEDAPAPALAKAEPVRTEPVKIEPVRMDPPVTAPEPTNGGAPPVNAGAPSPPEPAVAPAAPPAPKPFAPNERASVSSFVERLQQAWQK